MNILKTFSDNSIIYFDRGKFDDYCVYLEKNSERYAPKDIEYFQFFKNMSEKYGKEKVYLDFCNIYYNTTFEIENQVLELITSISETYIFDDSLLVDKWFSIIYLGMVAEERKENAILKKKIKRLGFHQAIIENHTAYFAANFSKGKKAFELLEECKKRGF